MKLEHIAIYVHNLEETKKFFINFFGATSNELYHNQKTGLKSYFLTFTGGARLEIMAKPEVVSSDKTSLSAGYTHIAFSVGSKEEVDKLTIVLRENGYKVVSAPRITGDGYYESCIAGPEGNLIEITE